MNSCNTCCNPKTPDCNSIEMSNLQRCNGVTMYGCGNPMYNVYCWDHAHPMCYKPEPVAIEHLCAYLRKDEASHIYATKQGIFDLQTIISNTYQTKEDAYTKSEIDEMIQQAVQDAIAGVDLSGYYTKSETDYKLNNYYTKSQADAKFAAANNTNIYGN